MPLISVPAYTIYIAIWTATKSPVQIAKIPVCTVPAAIAEQTVESITDGSYRDSAVLTALLASLRAFYAEQATVVVMKEAATDGLVVESEGV